ncbi:MAG TPA: heme-dependent oxidative N-demethylase subunit alpha family protein [Tepidisphaeraceae bacterium]|nr:heme-dependent oxidative N-demethylase subunit alpha family protein [Tepidisphaeraceae bacterium]
MLVAAHRPLPAPPFYFPLRHGRYDVAPGLIKFGRDLGGGTADEQLFQIDRTFDRFRAAKLASRAQRFEKYVCAANLSDHVAAGVALFITQRLASEHRHHFMLQQTGDVAKLHCALSGDTIEPMGGAQTLDALACQVQEDFAIVSTSGDGKHWISYLHVCLPNGWAPVEKIGGSFAAVHEPVAGMAEMNRRGEEFVSIMVRATEGLVRFAWGVAFTDELNLHPDRPRIPFDPANPRALLRVERQTIWGFPHVGATLFTIRPYLYDLADLRHNPATREPLVNALRTMPPASQVYKGIAPHTQALLAWLTSP